MPVNYASYLRTFEAASDKQRDRAAMHGYATLLMSESRVHRDKGLSTTFPIIEVAIQQKRIKFYFNEDGNVTGFVIWALLAEDVEKRVLSTGKFLMHESEWNEGDRFWIVDFLAPFGSVKYVLRDLRDNLAKTRESVKYIRNKNGRILVKQISRDSHASFFK